MTGFDGFVPVRGKPKARPRVTKSGHTYMPNTACWIWNGAVTAAGYGVRNNEYVHRMVYEIFKGPIPNGLEIDHLCRNKDCFNPDHLEAVTHAENVKRAMPYRKSTSRDACVAGHLLEGDNVYVTPDGRRQCRECGRRRAREYQRQQRRV